MVKAQKQPESMSYEEALAELEKIVQARHWKKTRSTLMAAFRCTNVGRYWSITVLHCLRRLN